jgi:hypothetical protein
MLNKRGIQNWEKKIISKHFDAEAGNFERKLPNCQIANFFGTSKSRVGSNAGRMKQKKTFKKSKGEFSFSAWMPMGSRLRRPRGATSGCSNRKALPSSSGVERHSCLQKKTEKNCRILKGAWFRFHWMGRVSAKIGENRQNNFYDVAKFIVSTRHERLNFVCHGFVANVIYL